jgi:hypothetical protein|eukprot:Stramenopile-MAST_4_protein_4162
MADFVNESNVATDSIEAVAAVSSSPTRPVLLRVKRKRDEDPLQALLVHEKIKCPRTVNSLTGAMGAMNASGAESEGSKPQEEDDDRAILLFRRLGTVCGGDDGVDPVPTKQLVMKFKRIQNAQIRNNARKQHRLGEDITWYGKKSLVQLGREGRAREQRELSKAKRLAILNRRRAKDRKFEVSKQEHDENVNETFEVMDIQPKLKRSRVEKCVDMGGDTKFASGEASASAQPKLELCLVPHSNPGDQSVSSILNPLESLMDCAILESMNGSPQSCDAIVEAIRQGGDINYARRSKNGDMMTAIMVAALHGRSDIVLQLIRGGCNIACVDKFGRSPLDFAVLGKHWAIETELRMLGGEHGAQIAARRKKVEKEEAGFVFDYYYLRGVAAEREGVENAGTLQSDDMGIANITSKYESIFRRAPDHQVAFRSPLHLLEDSKNKYDVSDDELFVVESDNDFDKFESDDSNAEGYYEKMHADDPDINFTSEDEDQSDEWY